MKSSYFQDKWNIVLMILSIIVVVELVALIRVQAQPCTLDFEVRQGVNFNQPCPTYHNCGVGSKPPIVK